MNCSLYKNIGLDLTLKYHNSFVNLANRAKEDYYLFIRFDHKIWKKLILFDAFSNYISFKTAAILCIEI